MSRSAAFSARARLALSFVSLMALAAPALAAPAATAAPAQAPAAAPAATAARDGRFASAAPASPGLGAPTGIALFALLALGALAWWRRRRLPAELDSSSIEVVAQASLGGRARVLWLRTAGQSSARNMIVTVTSQAVQVIDRWPDPIEAAAVAPPQVQRARRPGLLRTLPTLLPARRAASAEAAAESTSGADRATAGEARAPAAGPSGADDPRSDSRAHGLASRASDRPRPRWDTATHRVIEDRARHLEAAFSGESTFEGIPDDLAADLSADLPLLPDEPGAPKAPTRSPTELLARAWRRSVSRQPPEAPNAATLPPPVSNVRLPDSKGPVRSPDDGDPRDQLSREGAPPRSAPASLAARAPRAARGSIGHAAARPPAAQPSARRPQVRTELRAKRPAGARGHLPVRRRDEEDPQ